jgi:hypothetical protein
MQRTFIKMFPVYVRKCLLHEVVHNWVEKFSQGYLRVAGRPVQIVREATTQQAEKLI